MAVAEGNPYAEWLTLFANRNEVAEEYAELLRRNGVLWPGWRVLNAAIIDRWSVSGLRYIKTRAWRLALAGKDSGR